MWHHPSPWMLVFVAVDCKVSLLGITGQASHLGSFTFPPGLDIGKIKLKVSKITILDRAFLAPLLLNDCLGQRGMILGFFFQILHPIQYCAFLSLSCSASASLCALYAASLTPENFTEWLCCSMCRCACGSPSGITVFSLSVFLGSESNDTGSPSNLASALKSKH